MFRAILVTQWKWTRGIVLAGTMLGFAIPVASFQSARQGFGIYDFIGRMQSWGVGYALLAAGLGLTVALAAWRHDHQGRHVYALSLPVSRPRYALMRFGAGAVFLVPPIVAVLIGCLVVVAIGAIPSGLHTFPVALTLRFALAAGVAYALFFALGSATTKSAAIILGVIAALFFSQYLLEVIGVRYDLLSRIADFVFTSPGILSVFSGRWMLVDA